MVLFFLFIQTTNNSKGSKKSINCIAGIKELSLMSGSRTAANNKKNPKNDMLNSFRPSIIIRF